jgi:RNA polymerase sigma-B factor
MTPTTREDTASLFASLESDPTARDQLVELYTPLARHLARRFQGRGEPLEDLFQVAALALVKSVDRFEPERGVQFTTYAAATIIGEIKRHFRDKGWAVRVPRRVQEAGLRVSRASTELYQALGRSPTVPEIAKTTGLSDEEVLEGLDAANAYSAQSLDAPGDDDRGPSIDRLASEDDALEQLEGWTTVAPAIRALPERERYILYLRFFNGMTQSQIATLMGISQMHVSRLLARTLSELRASVGVDEPVPD